VKISLPTKERAWGPVLTAAGILLVVTARYAGAHLPLLHGHLVDLVQRSELILIGTVVRTRELGPRSMETGVRVDRVLAGRLAEPTLNFRGAVRFGPELRYMFFLRRASVGFECVQEPVSVFPAPPADDALYQRVVGDIAAAARVESPARAERLQAALLPALTASAAPLRYEAALDLAALVDRQHSLRASERTAVKQLLASPGCDPALQALLAPLVKEGDGVPGSP